MLTSFGTRIEVNLCTCRNNPFPHAQLVINEYGYHPLLSRAGITAIASQDDLDLDPKELEDLQRLLEQVSLPSTHLLDISALNIEPQEVPWDDPDEDDEDAGPGEASFHVCPICGSHGVLVNHEGETLSNDMYTKSAALANLDRLMTEGKIQMGDHQKVRLEILESSLPNDDEKTSEDEDNDEFE